MGNQLIESRLEFIRTVEKMKCHRRHTWNSKGEPESIADHSWRLALMAIVFFDIEKDIDQHKLLMLCIVHDLGEVFEGDISAKYVTEADQKEKKEIEAINKLQDILLEKDSHWLKALWEEYDAGITKEAKIAKALDKLETIMQHNQGKNPDDFDYAFNLDYGKDKTDAFEGTSKIRSIIDLETKARMITNEF